MASFLSNYKVFANIIVSSIFLDFIVRRLLFLTTLPSTFAYIITGNYIILTITLVALVYYRVYEFLLSDTKLVLKVPIVSGGICFIILMVVLLYLRTFDGFYYLLLATFYVMLTLLYIPILYLLISSAVKSKVEYKISISVFTSLLVVAFLISTILNILRVFPDLERFALVEYYFENVMIYSILVIMLYFSFYSIYKTKKHSLLNIVLSSIILVLLFVCSLFIENYTFANAFTQIFRTLSVRIILPNFIYIFVSLSFIYALLNISFDRSKKKTYFIALSVFILSGLSSTDLYLRLLSIFALVEILCLNIEDEDNNDSSILNSVSDDINIIDI